MIFFSITTISLIYLLLEISYSEPSEKKSDFYSTCYGAGNFCFQLKRGSFGKNAYESFMESDIPVLKKSNLESTAIRLSDLLQKLNPENWDQSAALILESGTNPSMNWKLSYNNDSSKTIDLNYLSKKPLSEISLSSTYPIYSFPDQLYRGNPTKILIASSSNSLFFSVNDATSNFNCQSTSLIFVPILWKAQGIPSSEKTTFFSEFNCTESCQTVLASNQFVRLCPFLLDRNLEVEETTKKPGSPKSVPPEVRILNLTTPLLLDAAGNSSFTVEATKLQENCTNCCHVEGAVNVTIFSSIENSVLYVEIENTITEGDFNIWCQLGHFKAVFDTPVHVLELSRYVSIKIHSPAVFKALNAQRTLIVTFTEQLPDFLSEEPFCLIDGKEYVATSHLQTLTCQLDALREVGTSKVFAVRQKALLDATLRWQDPIQVETEKSEEFPAIVATLSSDLLGINIISHTSTVKFPVGLLDCDSIFQDVSILGANSVCVGDGENVAVRFGHNSTLIPNRGIILRNPALNLSVEFLKDTVYPNFTVIYPPEVMPCKDIVRFEVKQVTGNGMMPMTFKWIVINGSTAFSTLASSTNERVLQVPRVELAKNNIFVVVGCNIADKCTTTQPLLVQLVDESTIFSVSMEGYEPSAPTSMGLKLLAMPSLQQCNITLTPNDVQYEWLINDKFVTYDDTIRLPAYSYNANQIVNVTLTANYKDSKLFRVIDAKMIRYTDLPLSVSVDCSKRQVAADQDLSIDATATDPNSKKSTIEFNWQCEAVNGTAEAMSPTCGIIGIDWNAKTLKIFAGRLKEKQTLNFSVTVTASEKQAAAFCIVVVAAKRLPDISFSILAEKKENINDFIRIQALVTSSGSQLNATWEVVRDGNNGFFSISTFLHSPTNIVRQVPPNSRIVVSLTIPPRSANVDGWTGLLAGKRYTIRLWATNSEGTSFADLAITTNSPPQKGSIEVTCANPCVALVSPVTFTVGDGWIDETEDLPLSYRFGIKTFFANNSTAEYWFTRGTAKIHQLYLPAAFNGTEIPCNERLAFAALLSVCDRLESCTTSDSEKFEVVHPENISIAFSDMITSFNTDLVNGNVFAALVKFYVMDLEVCRKSMDVTTADRVTMLLLHSVTDTSENGEYQEVLGSASALIDTVSEDVLVELIAVLSEYRRRMGHTIPNVNGRTKRSTENFAAVATINAPPPTEEQGNEMLKMYDILLGKDQQVVDVCMLNIQDFLSGFCIQLDSAATRIMSSAGGAYTAIQAQSVNCNIQGWNATYKISGTKDESITFSSSFPSSFSSWKCGESTSYCRHVCLASASFSQSVFADNHYVSDYLFSNSLSSISSNRSSSDLYQISLLDPISGLALPTSKSQVEYTANIPIFGYKTVDYYNCLLFHPRTGWDSTSCTSSSFATKKNDKDFISCTCSAYGILGVFTVSPPAPLHLPDHNEISLTFTVTTTRMMTQAQAQLVILSLGSMAEIDTRRFVNVATRGDPSGINSTLKATLRPPFKTEHLSNSYTIQALQKVIAAQQPDKFFKITNFTYWIVTREMNADGNARKIISKIDRSYQNIIGNNSDIISKRWSSSITTMLRISEYRIKNANIFMGIIFNFTITVPFESEKSPLSAEEISLMIQECSKYNELSFLSDQGESLEPNVIQDTDIVQLVVIHETNKLVLVIIVVLCAVLGLGSLYIGGAIVVKIRTDRLIEEERRRAVLVDPFLVSPPPPPPEYGNTTSSFAPTTVGQQYPHRRNRIEARHY